MITELLVFFGLYIIAALAIWRLVDIAYDGEVWEEEE